ncbi:hypothetical protein H0H87_006684, partial [Tephrocybe sp. NHM501043]
PITEELTTKGALDLDQGIDVEEAVEDFEEHTDDGKLQGPTIEILPASVSGDSAKASLIVLTAGTPASPSPLESSLAGPTSDSAGAPAGPRAVISMDFPSEDTQQVPCDRLNKLSHPISSTSST